MRRGSISISLARMRWIVALPRVALLAYVCFGASALRSDYQEGVDAYRLGDFARALREWTAVAESPPNTVNPAILAEAQYAIAMLYWLGQGVNQDTASSVVWLKEAANLNHAGAQTKLGFLYLSGQDVPRNEFEAFKWLQMAAQQGNVDAQYNLGVMYRDGVGVERSPEKARQWFTEAAAQGDLISAEILASLQTEPGAGVGLPIANETTSQPAEEIVDAPQDSDGGIFDESWITSRNPEHYTIQVIALKSGENLEILANQHSDMAPLAIYRLSGQNGALFILVQGEFSDLEAARQARDSFPETLQPREKIWIRQFANIQALISEEAMRQKKIP
jgi:hypothetical protein